MITILMLSSEFDYIKEITVEKEIIILQQYTI